MVSPFIFSHHDWEKRGGEDAKGFVLFPVCAARKLKRFGRADDVGCLA